MLSGSYNSRNLETDKTESGEETDRADAEVEIDESRGQAISARADWLALML